jgi:hypothetical protein
MRGLVDKLYADVATQSGLSTSDGEVPTPTGILFELISKDHSTTSLASSGAFRIGVCRDIIGNTICADLLDYLHRDWLHLGKPRYFDNRLLEYMEIRNRDHEGGENDSKPTLLINLRGEDRPRPDAATAIMDLLESRYQLSEIALFHRTKVAAAGMLERIFAEWRDSIPENERAGQLDQLVDELIDCSDSEMHTLLGRKLQERQRDSSVGAKTRERLDRAILLLQSLRLRQIHKEILARPERSLATRAASVQELYTGQAQDQSRPTPNDIARAASFRLQALRLLEADFDLPACSLTMYCPTEKMNSKIAEVHVLVGDVFDTLSHFENRQPDGGVTGGHLAAQQRRFRQLWRVSFAIDPVQRKKLKCQHLLILLEQAIDICVLKKKPTTGTTEDAVRDLATLMVGRKDSPFAGRNVRDQVIAARTEPAYYYPGGAPSLQAFIEP